MCLSLLQIVTAFHVLLIPGAISSQSAAFEFSSPSEVLTTINGRVRGARNRTGKDFVLGGLFPIHNAAVGGGECGIIRKETGLERMEAMLYAVDTMLILLVVWAHSWL